ncbi:MAG: hypothetical protein V2J55_16110 [Candidatus Competibacteraceae bacterium]|jgi:hypothetical protein|nr:hypothetical protein [Candidatus Competibacteraceae bacterium]
MSPPFANIQFDRKVLAYLGSYPRQVNHCLKKAFRDIRDGSLALQPVPTTLPGLFFTQACSHQILASVHKPSDTVVILDAIPCVSQSLP